MTKLVPADHILLSEVRQAVIGANPDSKQKWENAVKAEVECREVLRLGKNLPPNIQPLIDKIAFAQKCRDDLQHSADVEIRKGLRSGSLTPIAPDGNRIVHHDWRSDFDSDYVDVAGSRVLVYLDRKSVDNFVSELFNLPTLEKLPPKQRIVVEYLRKNFPNRDFGHLDKLRGEIIKNCPALNGSLDEKTFLAARQFIETGSR